MEFQCQAGSLGEDHANGFEIRGRSNRRLLRGVDSILCRYTWERGQPLEFHLFLRVFQNGVDLQRRRTAVVDLVFQHHCVSAIGWIAGLFFKTTGQAQGSLNQRLLRRVAIRRP